MTTPTPDPLRHLLDALIGWNPPEGIRAGVMVNGGTVVCVLYAPDDRGLCRTVWGRPTEAPGEFLARVEAAAGQVFALTPLGRRLAHEGRVFEAAVALAARGLRRRHDGCVTPL